MRGDYPLGALRRRWLRSVVLRSPLGPWYALTGSRIEGVSSLSVGLGIEVDGQVSVDLIADSRISSSWGIRD